MAEKKINVQGLDITVAESENGPVISITDMSKERGELSRIMLANWLRSANTLDFLAEWESKHNPNFNYIEFDAIRKQAGANRFIISVKEWNERTNAIGISSKAGRYGGTFAQPAIAIHFANWLSPKFYVSFIDRFFEYAQQNAELLGKKWDMVRGLSALNYKIHTEAVRENMVPVMDWYTRQGNKFYAIEADLLNEVVFGMTARYWRQQNPEKSGNLRDHASTEQLHLLANLEALNAEYLADGLSRDERQAKLEKAAEKQLPIIEAEIHRKLKKG